MSGPAILVDEPPPPEGTEESVDGDELPDPDGEPEEDEPVEDDEYWGEDWPAL